MAPSTSQRILGRWKKIDLRVLKSTVGLILSFLFYDLEG
jgi:hypothetical protein